MKIKTALFLSPLLLLLPLTQFFPAVAHEEKQHIIKMVPEGFTPSNIEITQGDTITFTNDDTGPRWPASNIHPTHEIYSDFDSKGPVEPGDSWSFKFTKSGQWKFHDHIKAEFVGDIKVNKDDHAPQVEEETNEFNLLTRIKIKVAKLYFKVFSGEAKRIMEEMSVIELTDRGNPNGETELRYKLAVFGSKAVMDDLLVDSGDGAIYDCHQPAHTVGRLGFELYNAEVFKDGSPNCHSGLYHGAMEGFIKLNGVDNLASNISELCSTFDTDFGNFQCYHGVGHGVLAYESYDLPAGLALCNQLEDSSGRSGCYGGAFMENIMVAQGLGAIPGHKTEWISDDPHFPCNKIAQDAFTQYECYQMQTSWMRTLYNDNGTKIIEQCLKAPAEQISVCFRSWGRDLASIYLRDANAIARGCKDVPMVQNYYDQCISGGLNVIIDFWGNKLTNEAAGLCYLVPVNNKEECYKDLAYRMNDIFNNSSQHARVCRYFELEYQNLCSALET